MRIGHRAFLNRVAIDIESADALIEIHKLLAVDLAAIERGQSVLHAGVVDELRREARFFVPPIHVRLVVLQRAYNHMNAGDLAVEKKDNAGALREYGAAEQLVPANAEMVFWHAVALVNMKRVDESLPLFKRAFSADPNWRTLVTRLPKSGLLPDDKAVIDRIVAIK